MDTESAAQLLLERSQKAEETDLTSFSPAEGRAVEERAAGGRLPHPALPHRHRAGAGAGCRGGLSASSCGCKGQKGGSQVILLCQFPTPVLGAWLLQGFALHVSEVAVLFQLPHRCAVTCAGCSTGIAPDSRGHGGDFPCHGCRASELLGPSRD